MSIISSIPVTLQNGTIADATQVMANFNAILTGVNTNAAENGVNTSITTLAGLTLVSSSPTFSGNPVFSGTPNFTGNPTATTQAYGDNTTKIATDAFVQAALQALYPVGSIYTNASSATNPATLFGFGTWTAFAAGRIPIGVGTGTDINGNTLAITAGLTGGEYTHTLTTPEMPSHNHPVNDPSHAHSFTTTGGGGSGQPASAGGGPVSFGNTNAVFTGISLLNTGGGGAHNIVQPYIGVYMWQRTA